MAGRETYKKVNTEGQYYNEVLLGELDSKSQLE